MQETNSRNVKSSWNTQVETIGETRLGKVKLNTKHMRQRLSKQKRKHPKKTQNQKQGATELKKKRTKNCLGWPSHEAMWDNSGPSGPWQGQTSSGIRQGGQQQKWSISGALLEANNSDRGPLVL